MTYLIAIIVMILLGAIIALLTFTNIGSGFSDRTTKGTAQEAITRVAEIEAAYVAYEAIYAGQSIPVGSDRGERDGQPICPEGSFLATPLFNTLITEKRLLKDRSSSSNFDFCIEPNGEDASTQGELIVVFNEDSEKVCSAINELLHNTPSTDCNLIPELSCCQNQIEITEE